MSEEVADAATSESSPFLKYVLIVDVVFDAVCANAVSICLLQLKAQSLLQVVE